MNDKWTHIFITITACVLMATILVISLCNTTYTQKAYIYPTVNSVDLLEVVKNWKSRQITEEEVIEVAVEEPTYEEEVRCDSPVGQSTGQNPEYWAQPNEYGYYQPSDIQTYGVIYWNGWRWTSYSQRIMPGEGLNIPGRHVDECGFVCDGDGYICLGTSDLDIPRGTVIDTLFGRQGKIYDYGYAPEHDIDIYTDW